MQLIDPAWLATHPLPDHDRGTDKNARGRVVLVGGAQFVPGALRLTGEAVLRSGAGKLQMATVAAVATALGVLVPEAAMIALPSGEDGEIAVEGTELLLGPICHADTLIVGPGMSGNQATEDLVANLLANPRTELTVLLDAAALACSDALRSTLLRHEGRVVMTPHHGEMAAMTDIDIEEIRSSPVNAALAAARSFGAVIALKAADTVIAAPDGTVLLYSSDCIGLATGGSGDVLSGIIGGLMARGASPLSATVWGVWAHGEAGRLLTGEIAEVGFLARDLLAKIPGLLSSPAERR
jgi:hydroxyethylthiazole kinase-like uncharacterized protein yjeF